VVVVVAVFVDISPACHAVYVLVGQPMQLTCRLNKSTSYQLAVELQWTRAVAGCSEAADDLRNINGFQVTGDGSSVSMLRKSVMRHEDEGEYICSGSSRHHNSISSRHALVVNSK